MITEISIRGYLVGPIWWPVGEECWKDLCYDVLREEGRFSEPPTLRDHLNHLVAELGGDFQGCSIAQGELIIRTSRRDSAGATITRTRAWPLDRFPSAKDYCHSDPDWCPSFPGNDE